MRLTRSTDLERVRKSRPFDDVFAKDEYRNTKADSTTDTFVGRLQSLGEIARQRHAARRLGGRVNVTAATYMIFEAF
jgi:hypothetical protein